MNTQILYHGDCSYSLTETKGWVANSKPPQTSEYIRNLVIYEPNNSIKHTSPIGIYSNVIFKNEYNNTSFIGFLNDEKESALKRGENVIEANSIKTQDNKTAIVRKYFIEHNNEYFGIAYINEP